MAKTNNFLQVLPLLLPPRAAAAASTDTLRIGKNFIKIMTKVPQNVIIFVYCFDCVQKPSVNIEYRGKMYYEAIDLLDNEERRV
jgi:hypothetical protein